MHDDVRTDVVLGALALAGLSGAATAFAANNDNPGIGDKGYGSQPGAAQAAEVGAQKGTGAASGAFGAFGKGNNMSMSRYDGDAKGAGRACDGCRRLVAGKQQPATGSLFRGSPFLAN